MGGHSGSMSLMAAVWHVRLANWGSLTYLQLPGLNGVPRFQEAIPGEAEVQQHAQHVLALVGEAPRRDSASADILVVPPTVSIHVNGVHEAHPH